ncbi:hypothetical protein LDG_6177 [Legionella drancourtii LLAP12]|uniref:Uncharacterized protein n=1 Tax=Legionella drancourtii LLAP12 TaxID=658187 RepID=G9ELB5_9GAMM|nr:hypothetical protein LDG_6177 [Legionella drancourtii LLAP12]
MTIIVIPHQELVKIGNVPTTNQCINKLSTAKNSTESAALSNTEDDSYHYNDLLESAINALRQISCFR